MTGAEFKKLKAFIRLLRSYCHFPDCPNIRYYPLHEPCTHKLDLNTSISWEVAYQDLYHILSELLDFLKQTKGGAS